MTDVAGVPVDQSQQIQIYFGGMFDQVLLGAPVYFWVIFALGMMVICGIILVAYYRYFILDKIWAFVECFKKGTPLALIRTRYRKAYFKSLTYIAQMFIDEESPDKWFAPALETAQSISGVNLVDCCDYYDWIQDPIMNQAVFELVDAWNASHPRVEDKIYDPAKFQEVLASGQMSDLFTGKTEIVYKKGDIPVPAFFIVNISKIEQYLPRTRSSAMFGGYTQHMANDLGNKDKLDWKSYVLPVAALCTCIIMSAIIGYVILNSH